MTSEIPYTNYTLVGKGSIGEVYSAKCYDGSVCAVKRFELEQEYKGLSTESLREISILQLFKGRTHDGVIGSLDVLDYDDYLECHEIAMPLMKSDLSTYIGNETVTYDTKYHFMKGVFTGLAFMHANGIIHRDIKPENILVSHEGNAILADFSLSKPFDDTWTEQCSHTGNVVTEGYRAPEVLAYMPYGFKIDVWSAGVVMYQLFVTQNSDSKFDTDEFHNMYKNVYTSKSYPHLSVIHNLTERNPENRPTSLEALHTYFNSDYIPPLLERRKHDSNVPRKFRRFCKQQGLKHPTAIKAAYVYMQNTKCTKADAYTIAHRIYDVDQYIVSKTDDYAKIEYGIMKAMGFNMFLEF